jgi:large subunit ribosomal protein L15
MNLSELRPPKGQNHKPKRVGRGMGSGLGKTSGRGEKGQKSRSGYSQKRGFEGGQMPLHRRTPKRGFTNIFKKRYAVVNLATLGRIEGAETITPELLLERGAIRKIHAGLRVLGEGELGRALVVRAHHFSESARQKIEASGGRAELIPAK